MMLEIAFAVILLLFVLISIILEYHWKKYVHNFKMLFVMRLFYYGGSAFFVFVILAVLLIDVFGFVRL
ncbi:MAG: hypothetical protein O3A36_03425 [bacterium]|nr:hypothetical protein [bacterium]